MLITQKIIKIFDKLEGKSSSLRIITIKKYKNLFLMRQSMTLFKNIITKKLIGEF